MEKSNNLETSSRKYTHRTLIAVPDISFSVILAVIVAATAMTTIAPQILTITKASSAAEELFQTIDRVSEIDPLSEIGLIPTKCIGEVQIKDVHFAYPARPDTAVLKGLTLSVPANKTTAIVGASGSGKSTIIGLLERWYNQAEGKLYLDGVDTRELNLRWLRTNIRLVQQEPTLFSSTVFENVAFGLFGAEKSSLPEAEQRLLVEKVARRRTQMSSSRDCPRSVLILFLNKFHTNLPGLRHPGR